MQRKKKEYQFVGGSWLDTYADMVTLLLTFFVLLFSMSTIDSEKWKVLVQAFMARGGANQQIQLAEGDQKGSETEDISLPDSPAVVTEASPPEDITEVEDFDQLYWYLKQYVEANNLQGSVKLYKGDGYTFLTFTNNIFFDGNSAVLRPEGKRILDFLCDAVKNIPGQIEELRFFGHTAKDSIVTTEETQIFDRELSMDRAKNVLLYVQLRNVIEPKKLVGEGYGSFRPVVPFDGTEETRVKNRRVEIYISKTGTATVSLDEIYSDMNKNAADGQQ